MCNIHIQNSESNSLQWLNVKSTPFSGKTYTTEKVQFLKQQNGLYSGKETNDGKK